MNKQHPLRPLRPVAHPVARLAILCSILTAAAAAQSSGVNLIGIVPHPNQTTFPFPASPPGNPFHGADDTTRTPEERQSTVDIAALGKLLFWDEQVSTDNTMACGTCHLPEVGGTEKRLGPLDPNGIQGSPGMLPQNILGDYYFDPAFQGGTPPFKRVTGRNAPTMINSAFFRQLFWDKRAGPQFFAEDGVTPIPGFENFAALEQLATLPPLSDIEMAHDGLTWASNELQNKLANSTALRFATPSTVPADIAHLQGELYSDLFADRFDVPAGENPVSRERFAQAVAHYMRTLVSDQAPVDMPGGMTPSMIAGFNIMKNNQCFNCHSHSLNPQLNLAEGGFMDPFDALLSDGALKTVAHPDFDLAVKTPSLRNVGLKLRYFHHGTIGSDGNPPAGQTELEQAQFAVMDFYNTGLPGGQQPPAGTRFFPAISGSDLTNVMAFLFDGLTDPRVRDGLPPFDRPDLYSERLAAMDSDQDPTTARENRFGEGTGVAGVFGSPLMISNSPLDSSSGEFKVGMAHAGTDRVAIVRLALSQLPAPRYIGTTFEQVYIFPDADGFATVRMPEFNSTAMVGTTWYARWQLRAEWGEKPGFYTDYGPYSEAAEFIVQ